MGRSTRVYVAPSDRHMCVFLYIYIQDVYASFVVDSEDWMPGVVHTMKLPQGRNHVSSMVKPGT